jgi:hypothetical protein
MQDLKDLLNFLNFQAVTMEHFWGLLTVYIEKLHSLELLIIEELESSYEHTIMDETLKKMKSGEVTDGGIFGKNLNKQNPEMNVKACLDGALVQRACGVFFQLLLCLCVAWACFVRALSVFRCSLDDGRPATPAVNCCNECDTATHCERSCFCTTINTVDFSFWACFRKFCPMKRIHLYVRQCDARRAWVMTPPCLLFTHLCLFVSKVCSPLRHQSLALVVPWGNFNFLNFVFATEFDLIFHFARFFTLPSVTSTICATVY